MSHSTIDDIAQKLGVSKTLVSFVLNGKQKKHRISEAMSNKVIKMAQKMGYKPNHFARGLRTGRTNTIGLVVSDISNPVFARLCRFVENEANKLGYHLVIASSDEKSSKMKSIIESLIDKKTDGFIIVPSGKCEEAIRLLEKNKKPFVFIDRSYGSGKFNYITSDNYEASYRCTQQLLSENIQQIAFIGLSNQLSNFNERFKGYADALKNNGRTLDRSFIKRFSFHSINTALPRAVDEVLSQKPQALFFANNTLAIKGLTYIQQKYPQLIDSLNICCFDNDPAFAFYSGRMIIIEQAFDRMAYLAMQFIDNNMKGELETLKVYEKTNILYNY